MSEKCYKEVYGDDNVCISYYICHNKQLEPGEIDQRKGAFRNCVLGGGSDEYKASKASDGDYDQ